MLAAAGVLLGLPDLVALGAGGMIASALATVLSFSYHLDQGRGALSVMRSITPSPTDRGRSTTARLELAAGPSARSRARLARLQLTEQAALELTGGLPLTATVHGSRDRVVAEYPLCPPLRGRWPLGPVRVTSTDLLGLVSTRQNLGAPVDVVVRPRVHMLPARSGRAFDSSESVASGARATSPDDAMVRDYVAGDDPRRVHWSSAARRGRLIVRADESSAVAPVTIILDRGVLPMPHSATSPSETGEWAIECAVSIAIAMLHSGHRTRVVPTNTSVPPTQPYLMPRSPESDAHILQSAVDLIGHLNDSERNSAILRTTEQLRRSHEPGELVFAVLGAMSEEPRRAIAISANSGTHFAIVVMTGTTPAEHTFANFTAERLRHGGWVTCVRTPEMSLPAMWAQLLENRT